MFAYSYCTCYARRNSDATPTHIPKLRTQRHEQIAYIDAEILLVEDAIVKLVKQRASLKRKRNAFAFAVNLPPEILALIFEYACLPNCLGSTPPIDVSKSNQNPGSINLGLTVGVGSVTPLFIGTVCTAWRTVSRGASQLWNSVTLYLRNGHASVQAELLRCWLTHAGKRPLSIKLIEDEENQEDDDDSWGIDLPSSAVLDVLGEHAEQWHTVDMFLPASWKSPLRRISHSFHSLKRLTLRVAEGTPSIPRVDIFERAPALREVTLVGYGVTDVVLPWSQLSRLDAECFSAYEALETLRMCSALRHCQLEQLYRGIVPFTSQPFIHYTLEALELVVDATTGLGNLFSALTLPRLKHLVFALPDDCVEQVMKWVLPLLRRSECRLERLHLVGVTPKQDDLVECLRTMPTLKTLLLLNPAAETGGKLTDHFLKLMSPANMSHILQRNAIFEHSTQAKPHDTTGWATDWHTTEVHDVRWDEGRGGEDSLMDLDSTTSQDEERLPLVPNLETLIYQGPVEFSSQTLVNFLLARWFGFSPDTTSNMSSLSTFAALNMDVDSIDNRPPSLMKGTTTRLRSATFTTPSRILFEAEDAKTIQALQRVGMHLEFLVDPNAT